MDRDQGNLEVVLKVLSNRYNVDTDEMEWLNVWSTGTVIVEHTEKMGLKSGRQDPLDGLLREFPWQTALSPPGVASFKRKSWLVVLGFLLTACQEQDKTTRSIFHQVCRWQWSDSFQVKTKGLLWENGDWALGRQNQQMFFISLNPV